MTNQELKLISLEKALGFLSFTGYSAAGTPNPKTVKELIDTAKKIEKYLTETTKTDQNG